MAAYSRNVLIFVALAALALTTWIVARNPGAVPASDADADAGPGGYYLVNAVLEETDAGGDRLFSVAARRIEQPASDADLLFYDMSVEYSPDTDISWDISAARGRAPPDRAFLDLEGAVRFAQVPEADGEPIVFETSELRLHIDELRASSDRPISLRRGASEISATGLELDLETDEWKLISDAKIRFYR